MSQQSIGSFVEAMFNDVNNFYRNQERLKCPIKEIDRSEFLELCDASTKRININFESLEED